MSFANNIKYVSKQNIIKLFSLHNHMKPIDPKVQITVILPHKILDCIIVHVLNIGLQIITIIID